MTTSTGALCYDADFLPYGQEVDYTNTCAQNYKFEGKERDTETGNDNFGARYYRSLIGRWQSPDWSAIPEAVPYANLTNPQTLNLYAMVSDNPETFADLDGHACSVLLGNSDSVFCQRAALYAGVDAKVSSQTRFFGAADAVNEAMADMASWAGPVSRQTTDFLENVGAGLEKMNLAEAHAIEQGTLHGPGLDTRMVHLEQTEVQKQLDSLRKSDPVGYAKAIKQINGALNSGSRQAVGGLFFPTDKAFNKVLGTVRHQLNRNIDFSRQSDREAIGNALIKNVETTGGCKVTGSTGKKLQGC